MAESAIQQYEQTIAAETKKARRKSTVKIFKYILGKLLASLITVSVAVYLTILLANMGGHVDEMKKSFIREQVAISVSIQINNDPAMRTMSQEEKTAMINQQVALQERALGLDKPFIQRSFTYWKDAMTLNLGFSEGLTSDSGSKQVRNILLERLPATLALLGVANFFLFFTQLFVALRLSRREGGLLDKIVQFLVPTSAAPSWFYGIFLVLIFPVLLNVLPYGGLVSAPPPTDPFNYALSVGKHLILPVSAIVLANFFIGLYSQRTFFLIFSSEDYVELARAKGLPDSMVERKYILRPTLPTIITSFALTMIGLWQGSLFLEIVFNWPGIGNLLSAAINIFDTPIIVATTVLYAYLLVITVFLLDFIYALVDPRVRVGEGSR